MSGKVLLQGSHVALTHKFVSSGREKPRTRSSTETHYHKSFPFPFLSSSFCLSFMDSLTISFSSLSKPTGLPQNWAFKTQLLLLPLVLAQGSSIMSLTRVRSVPLYVKVPSVWKRTQSWFWVDRRKKKMPLQLSAYELWIAWMCSFDLIPRFSFFFFKWQT